MNQGHEVTVVTAHPNYPLGRFYDSVESYWPSRRVENGVTVWRLPFVTDHSLSKARRFLSYASFAAAISAAAPLLTSKPDAVWVYHAPFTVAVASLWFRHLRRVKVGFICADLWPESFEAAGVAPPARILTAMYAYSRWINRSADMLVATTKGMARRYEKDGIDPSRMRLVPLWVDGSRVVPSRDAQEPVVPRLVYAGNLGPAQALDVLLRGARQLQDERVDLEIHIYGAGSDEARLRGLAEDLELRNVRFLGRVSPEEAARASAAATATIVHLIRTPMFAMTVPSKLASCLSVGRPVLCGLSGEALQLAQDSGGAIPFQPGGAADFVRAVKDLLKLEESDRRAVGDRARAYFEEHLHPTALLARYAELTSELLAGAKGQ